MPANAPLVCALAMLFTIGCEDSSDDGPDPAPGADAGDAGLDAGDADEPEGDAPVPSDTGRSSDACEIDPADCEGTLRDCVCVETPPAGEPLCGELQGSLTADGSPYLLGCDTTVPEGATLTVEADVELRLGTHVLATRGVLDVDAAHLVLDEAGTLLIQPGGVARLGAAHIDVRTAGDGGAAITLDGGRLEARGTRITDGTRRVAGVLARGDGQLDLEDVALEGLWSGVRAEAESGGRIARATISGCSTGVLTLGAARPSIEGSTFRGNAFDLLLDPAYFDSDRPGVISGNDYDPEGVPIGVTGTVEGEVTLGPIDGIDTFQALALAVGEGALLHINPGTVIDLAGDTIEVRGELVANGIQVPNALATAFRVRVGGHATFTDLVASVGNAPGRTLLESTGGVIHVRTSRLTDDTAAAVCVGASGRQAELSITESDFLGCWVGVQAANVGATDIQGSTFTNCPTGLDLDRAGVLTAGGNAFRSEGVHIHLSPAHFAVGGGEPEEPADLSSNDFGDAGTPVRVSGSLEGSTARLRAVLPGEALQLGVIQVGPLALLSAEPGLRVIQRGAIVVEGEVDLPDITFSGLQATAIDWREASGGRVTGASFNLAGDAPFAAIRITDASPIITGITMEGGSTGGTGVIIAGTPEVEDVARPEITDSTLRSLHTGIRITGDAEPLLERNTFEEVENEVVNR